VTDHEVVDSHPAVFLCNDSGQVVHTHACVVKQYNLVLAKGLWCHLAWRMTRC